MGAPLWLLEGASGGAWGVLGLPWGYWGASWGPMGGAEAVKKKFRALIEPSRGPERSEVAPQRPPKGTKKKAKIAPT